MTTIYVNWGEAKVKLTWVKGDQLPPLELITSVHGFCFHNDQILLVKLTERGWDMTGGHIDPGETPEECFKRETMEEAYVSGSCTLLGSITVDHSENIHWNENGKYPKVGYQVFYRMEIDVIHEFRAEYESAERIFIDQNQAEEYYHEWHELYEEILNHSAERIIELG
ncbi:NUDIX hydrolase [Mesobacillus subterraneus]|uniref:NUDIX domain-containing protein n=1 Tax=Mesobacillus subterraneus TaxID=285983 RepID=A0A427TMH7_9BACI|nr:NUDIX domain-containing protein [Mesobacillus subterraneus]RSD25554.1 NUDIX domain-containing protein [Mesobacillus subterraneus]